MRTLFLATLIFLAPVTMRAQSAGGEPVVIASSYAIRSAILGQDRRVNVYLPPGYAQDTTSDYPALILLDGGVGEDFLHIAGIATLAADFRQVREFILVGVEGIDRYHDLVHPATVPADRARLPTAGGAEAFREFLAGELLPWVRENFRITGETVLMGESAAGLFVVETFLRRPQTFQGYVAVSPMLWWDDQSLARQADDLVRKPFPGGRRLFLAIADEGGAMQEGVDRLRTALARFPNYVVRLIYRPMPEETHGTVFHPAAWLAVRTLFATADSASIPQ